MGQIGYAPIFGWEKEGVNYANIGEGFDKFAKELEKYNIKLIFWAGAFGAPEPMMYAQQFDDIKDWEKAGPALAFCPIERTRTILGWDYTA